MRAVQSPQTPLSISVIPNRGEVGIVIAGELDLCNADAVAAAVEEVWSSGFAHVVLDLHGVEFIDSAGLRMLIRVREAAERDRRSVSLVPAQPAAQRIFAMTRTDGLFDWRRRFTV